MLMLILHESLIAIFPFGEFKIKLGFPSKSTVIDEAVISALFFIPKVKWFLSDTISNSKGVKG